MFDQHSLQRAARKFRTWPSYSEIAEFFDGHGEIMETAKPVDSKDPVVVTNLAHGCASAWVEDNWAAYWRPALRDGYSADLFKWLVSAYAQIAYAGGIEHNKFDPAIACGYEVTKKPNIVPEDWRLEEFKAKAEERRRAWREHQEKTKPIGSSEPRTKPFLTLKDIGV